MLNVLLTKTTLLLIDIFFSLLTDCVAFVLSSTMDETLFNVRDPLFDKCCCSLAGSFSFSFREGAFGLTVVRLFS